MTSENNEQEDSGHALKYSKTLPELAKEAAKSPYGGITHRPRELKGYINLPDGKRYWLGQIEVAFDGYGDGLITDVELIIEAEKLEKCGNEE